MKPGDLDLTTIIDPVVAATRVWACQFIAQEVARQLAAVPTSPATPRLTDLELRQRNLLRIANGQPPLPGAQSPTRARPRGAALDEIARIRSREP